MRFLVDAYRWVILVSLAILLVTASYLVFTLFFEQPAGTPFPFAYLSIASGIAVALVLFLGLTATFISIHDRFAEVSDHTRRIAEVLENSRAPQAQVEPSR